jgi:hemerythrin-like metal-binding protein
MDINQELIDYTKLSSPIILNHPSIDTLHEEMTILLEAAVSVPDSELTDALTCLQRHCEHHFTLEESLMTDHRFSGYNEHRHEHQQLLTELNGMVNAVERGRHRLARAWLRERLPEWFRLHVANLDGLLVSFLSWNSH